MEGKEAESMKILVVCGAGASSTFVAQRVRRAAETRGRDWHVAATTTIALEPDLDGADVLLVGPHLQDRLDDLEPMASARNTAVVLLPDDVFRDHDGERTLALIDAAVAASSSTSGHPAGSPERRRP